MSKVYSNKALPPGTILREWRLEQVLGIGGFGIVYKGRGIYFDELVAIKEYFPSAISDRKDGDTVVPTDSDSEEVHALGLKKFVEEAKLLWNLSTPTRHPNIVSVRSLFEVHGTAYMVMDFEDGAPLSDMIKRRKKFTEASLMALIRPIAEGLDRAHRVGVLHRDIKPANILISEDGRPVLIDFGSARFDSGKATSTKVTFHTPPYAAIEQYVKTYEQGPWTDIYALGVVLYECVTGTKPPEVLERMHGGLGHPLAEGDWPDFSLPFLRAIDAAMIIRPADRPQTISDWLEHFDAPENAPITRPNAGDDAPTRFAAFSSEEIVPVAAPEPELETVEEPAPQPIKLKEPKKSEAVADVPKSGGMRKVALAGGVLAVVAAGAAALMLPSGPGSSDSGGSLALDSGPGGEALEGQDGALVSIDENAIAAGNDVAPEAVADTASIDRLGTALAGLASAARSAGLGEGRRAADASARIRSLSNEAKAAAAQPDSEATVQAKFAEANTLARSASAAVGQSARRAADAKGAQLTKLYPWSKGSGAAATFRTAMADVKSGASAASSGNASQAIDGARRSIGALQRLNAAYPKVVAMGLPARRTEFASIAAAARSTGAKVIEMGRSKKPALFASRQTRDNYKLRQANAAQAQAELGKIAQISDSIAAVTSVTSAEALVKQAKDARAKLASLETSSTAAMPRKQDEREPANSN